MKKQFFLGRVGWGSRRKLYSTVKKGIELFGTLAPKSSNKRRPSFKGLFPKSLLNDVPNVPACLKNLRALFAQNVCMPACFACPKFLRAQFFCMPCLPYIFPCLAYPLRAQKTCAPCVSCVSDYLHALVPNFFACFISLSDQVFLCLSK